MNANDRMWKKAGNYVKAVLTLAEQNQIQWKELETPKPDAMRSFEGRSGPYVLNVVQANVIEAGGIVHEGVLVVNTGTIIRLPRDVASNLWHKAAAQRN